MRPDDQDLDRLDQMYSFADRRDDLRVVLNSNGLITPGRVPMGLGTGGFD